MSSVKIENSSLSLYIDDIRQNDKKKKEKEIETQRRYKRRSRLGKGNSGGRGEMEKNSHCTQYMIRSMTRTRNLLNIFVHIYIKIIKREVPVATFAYCIKYYENENSLTCKLVNSFPL